MITASALLRNCGHPRALKALAPTTAKERDARARRDAAAEKGTAFHEAIQRWAAPGTVIPEVADDEVRGWIEMLAMSWAPRPGMLFELAVGLRPDGTGVECDEPEPHVYVARDGSPLLTAGRADVVSSSMWWLLVEGRAERELHIVTVRDWKTGKWPVDPPARNLQTTALALAVCSLARADGFRREIYYVRDGFTDGDELPVMVGSPEHAQALEDVRAAAQLDDTPRPGEHCEVCWEKRANRCAHAA
jgi:hypothetical protein